MSFDLDPQSQIGELIRLADDQLDGLLAVAAALRFVEARRGVGDEDLLPVRARFAEIARVAGEVAGLGVQAEVVASATPEAAPADAVQQRPGTVPERPLLGRRLGDESLSKPAAEVTKEPVSIDLKGEEVVVINGVEIPLTKYDKAILHALMVANGDMITADELRLTIRATSSHTAGDSKVFLDSVGRLARRISRKLGYGVIAVAESEDVGDGPSRFGLPMTSGWTYEADITPPVPGSSTPRLVGLGRVEGSLFGGFIRFDNLPVNSPANPITIEVLSDNVLFIRDGHAGRVVEIVGNNLFTANALLAMGGQTNRGAIKRLTAQTGDDRAPLAKVSTYVDYLGAKLGAVGGRDIVEKDGDGIGTTYGFHPDVVFIDRRAHFVAEAAAGDAGPDRGEGTGESIIKVNYRAVLQSLEDVGDADEQPQAEVEQLVADDTGVPVERVKDMLVLHRLEHALGRLFMPEGDVDGESFTEHMRMLYGQLDAAFRSIDFISPKARLAEANILAYHLGLPPEIPYLRGLEVAMTNRSVSYEVAYRRIRENGLSYPKMNVVLQSTPEDIEAVFDRAIMKLRDWFSTASTASSE